MLEKYFDSKSRSDTWNISHDSGVLISNFLADKKLNNILEVGTSTGISTCYLALAPHHPSITTIESHTKRRETAIQHFKELNLDNITSIQGHAPSVLNQLNNNFDCIFLDCIKLYYNDIARYALEHYPNLRYIIADNTISHKDAMQDFFSTIATYKNTTLELGGGLTIVTIRE